MLQSKSNNLVQIILVAFIVIIAAYFRLESAITGTFAYTYDIGRDLLSVSDLVTNHHLSLIGSTTGLPGIFYGPWWFWLLAPFYVIVSGDPRGIDAIMGLTGVLTVVVGYLIGVDIKNKNLGLVIASILAISPRLIGTSSQIWNPNIAPLILILIIFLLLKLFKEKHSIKIGLYMTLLGILGGLTFDSIEIVYGSIQFIAVTFFIFTFLRKK